MQKLFLEIYLFLLCINAGILIVESTPVGTPLDIPLISPMNATETVTSVAMPPVFMLNHCTVSGEIDWTIEDSAACGTAGGTWTVSTGTLAQNMTTNVVNGTGSTTVLDPIQDNFFWPFALFETFINFLTGGFIWQLFAVFGFPSIFVYVMQSVVGLLLVVTIVYYFTGR
tara:strand:+ start:1799 stop:2308 length:510 start_codon:yes stop_codon:yes gene_type:complete